MTGCPLAYTDPCNNCAQYGNCSPSHAVQKIQLLENRLNEMHKLLEKLASKSIN